jgi:multicomponent Na+:H+ antiporter subunit E
MTPAASRSGSQFVARMLPSAILRAALFVAVWWVLTDGRVEAWGVGAVSVTLALLLSLKLMPPSGAGFSLIGLAGFLVFFLLRSVKGGVQVARIALRPRLDLRPDVLEIPVRLPAGAAQVMLAGTLGLLPGTLAVAIDANLLQLHVLDRRLPAEAEVRAIEKRIARLLGVALR